MLFDSCYILLQMFWKWFLVTVHVVCKALQKPYGKLYINVSHCVLFTAVKWKTCSCSLQYSIGLKDTVFICVKIHKYGIIYMLYPCVIYIELYRLLYNNMSFICGCMLVCFNGNKQCQAVLLFQSCSISLLSGISVVYSTKKEPTY